MPWDEWFKGFEENNLAFLYEDEQDSRGYRDKSIELIHGITTILTVLHASDRRSQESVPAAGLSSRPCSGERLSISDRREGKGRVT